MCLAFLKVFKLLLEIYVLSFDFLSGMCNTNDVVNNINNSNMPSIPVAIVSLLLLSPKG